MKNIISKDVNTDTQYYNSGNLEFSREHNFNLLIESLWKQAIYFPLFHWPETLTNHIGVSDIGGPKVFYRPDTARVLSIG